MEYTVNKHFDIELLNHTTIPRKVYEEYRLAMGKPDYMPEFDNQDTSVKMAWIFACLNVSGNGKSTGESLYNGYFTAVEGVALKNNQVKLSKFEDMDEARRDAWNRASHVFNIENL